MARTVFCQYEKREAEGLDFVPWPGETGRRVFDNIGAESIAWAAGKPEAAGYYVFALPKR